MTPMEMAHVCNGRSGPERIIEQDFELLYWCRILRYDR